METRIKKTLFAACATLILSATACSSHANAPKTAEDGIAVCTAQDTLSPQIAFASETEVDSVSYLLGVRLAMMFKSYGFGELNFDMIKEGASDCVKAQGDKLDPDFGKQFKIDPQQKDRIMMGFIEKKNAYTALANKKAEKKFLKANRKKEGVRVTESGLQYIITEKGSTDKPSSDKDTVYVHYKLSNIKGEVIEEIPEGRPSVRLSLSRVVSGWAEGMKLIGAGGKARLFVPSELGYGDRGTGGSIGPNATLVFDVQLDSVKHFTAPAKKGEL